MITIKLHANKQKIVGIYSPQPRSGKSTLANTIITNNFERHSFATTGKGMLNLLYTQLGYTPTEAYEMLNGNAKTQAVDGLYCDSRHLMQTLMTDWARQTVDPGIWIRTMEQRLKTVKNPNIVIDDLRFPNEYHWIKSKGGFVICVLRPGIPGYEHASEGRLNHYPFDTIINNTGALQEYKTKCNDVIDLINNHFGIT